MLVDIETLSLESGLESLWAELLGDEEVTDLKQHFAATNESADKFAGQGDAAQAIANLYRLKAVRPLLQQRPPKGEDRTKWYTEMGKKLGTKGRTLRERMAAVEAVESVLAENPPIRLLRRHMGQIPRAVESFKSTGNPDKRGTKPELTADEQVKKWEDAIRGDASRRLKAIAKLPAEAQVGAVERMIELWLEAVRGGDAGDGAEVEVTANAAPGSAHVPDAQATGGGTADETVLHYGTWNRVPDGLYYVEPDRPQGNHVDGKKGRIDCWRSALDWKVRDGAKVHARAGKSPGIPLYNEVDIIPVTNILDLVE